MDNWARIVVLLCNVALAVSAYGTIYCDNNGNDPCVELQLNPTYRYSGVGFINNGCTATLIDDHHILTAAHCIANTKTGRYWKASDPFKQVYVTPIPGDSSIEGVPLGDPLTFYLNYH